MKMIFTVLLLALVSAVHAQSTLSGNIFSASNERLPAVSVSLKSFAGDQKSTAADSSGRFSFAGLANGRYILSASHTGFQLFTSEFQLTRDTVINIILQVTDTKLDEVVVSGSKAVIERSVGKTTYNIGSSVTATGGDVLQALGQIPGVRINNNVVEIVGKGMTRVMINDRLIQLSGEDLTRYLKSISANQISKIEVLTNPPAKYDADGNAGLINIITRHNRQQGYAGNLQLAGKYYLPGQSMVYGIKHFGELAGSGNISFNSGKWSVYANADHMRDRHLEGFETDVFYPHQSWMQTDTGLYKGNVFNVMAGADFRASNKTTIGASYMFGRALYDGSDNVNNPIYDISGKLDSTLKTYATYYPIAWTNSLNVHADIKLDTSGKNLFFNADYFTYYRTDSSDFESNAYLSTGQVKPESRTRYYDNNKQLINLYTFKSDLDLPTPFAKYSFGAKLSFITNYSNAFYYKKLNGDLDYDANLSNEFDYTENTQSLYGDMSKEIAKWKLQVGLRGELTQTKGYSYTLQQTTTNNYFRVFPSLLATYRADEKNTYAFSVGRRINRPTFWNLNPFKSLFTAYSYGEGNPYLQPEYNTNAELSHSYKNLLLSSVYFNLTNNGFNNVTFPEADTNLVYTIPLNFIKIYRIGITENLSLEVSNWWQSNELVNLHYAKAHSRLTNVADVEGWGLYFSSTNTFFFNQSKTLSGALNFWYQFPEVDHIGKSDAYYKLDAGIKANVMKKKLDIAFSVNDLFRSSASAFSTTVNGIPVKFTNFQINRFVQLSLSYRFGNSSGASVERVTGNEEERGRIH